VRIFVCYRRDDTGGYAGRLHDALAKQFGVRNVFQDVEAISAGEDFTDAIERALDASEAALVVIGPAWLQSPAADGTRRLDDPEDYVRLEVAAALAKSGRLVPVLVGGAALPSADDLPAELKPLANKQAVELRDASWNQDFDHLVDSIQPRRSRPGWLIPSLAGAAVALVALGAWQLMQGDDAGDEAGTEAELAICADPSGESFTSLELLDAPQGEELDDAGRLQFVVHSGGWRELSPGIWEVILNTSMTNTTAEEVRHADFRYDGLAVGGRQFAMTCSHPEVVVGPGLTDDGRVGFEVTRDPLESLQLLLDEDVIALTP